MYAYTLLHLCGGKFDSNGPIWKEQLIQDWYLPVKIDSETMNNFRKFLLLMAYYPGHYRYIFDTLHNNNDNNDNSSNNNNNNNSCSSSSR